MKLMAIPTPWVEEISMFLLEQQIEDPEKNLVYCSASGTTPTLSEPASVILSESLEPHEVIREVLASRSCHILQKNTKHWKNDLRSTIKILQNKKDYFADPSSLILNEVIRRDEIIYRSAQDKALLKEKVSISLAPLESQIVNESVDAIVEELYMNSMIDAPREAKRRNQEKHSYEQGFEAKMTLAYSNDQLLVCCEDPFGSLDIYKFLNRMNQVYEQGAGQVMNHKEGAGAGIGCVIIFENCESLYLGVEPSGRTVVCCLISLGLGYRQKARIKKSIHLIESKS